jgi:hypothetical protein
VKIGNPLVTFAGRSLIADIYVFRPTESYGNCGVVLPYPVAIPIGSKAAGASWWIAGLNCVREKGGNTFRCDGNRDNIVGVFKGEGDEIVEATENATREGLLSGKSCTSTWRIEGRKLQQVPWPP